METPGWAEIPLEIKHMVLPSQMCSSITRRKMRMEDFMPSRVTSPINISCHYPGLEHGTLEFALFTGTTRQPCLCCAPVASATSSCAVMLPKILYPPPPPPKSISLGKYPHSQVKKGWRAVSHARYFWLLACYV